MIIEELILWIIVYILVLVKFSIRYYKQSQKDAEQIGEALLIIWFLATIFGTMFFIWIYVSEISFIRYFVAFLIKCTFGTLEINI